MVNQTKANDPRFIKRWKKSGAIHIGEAYAFFDCGASKQEIERELPFIRETSRIPGRLELSLTTTKELEKDPNADPKLLDYIKTHSIYSIFSESRRELKAFAQPTKMTDLNYVLKAVYTSKTNAETASQLGDVLNGIYYTWGNNEGDEVFKGAIIGKGYRGKYGMWKND